MLLARSGESHQHETGVALGPSRRLNLLLQPLQSRQKLGVAARLLLACFELLSEVIALLQRPRDVTQSRFAAGGPTKLPRQLVLLGFHTRHHATRHRSRAS